jgi:hypothetical protein
MELGRLGLEPRTLRVSSPNFGYHNILPMGAAGRIVSN